MREKGVSGGSSDIKPEPNGLQNGTAPLQNALTISEGSNNLSSCKGIIKKGAEFPAG